LKYSSPAHAENGESHQARVERWTEALDEMRQCLKTLDEAHAPWDIGAHLDLAINRFEEEIQALSQDFKGAAPMRERR
jgi:hypothetical protein